MSINFSVQNFSSIKDKQTLSFEATNSTHLEDAYIVNLGGLTNSIALGNFDSENPKKAMCEMALLFQSDELKSTLNKKQNRQHRLGAMRGEVLCVNICVIF